MIVEDKRDKPEYEELIDLTPSTVFVYDSNKYMKVQWESESQKLGRTLCFCLVLDGLEYIDSRARVTPLKTKLIIED